MRNKDCFSSYHPIINFIFYILVFVFALSMKHPICIGVSLISSIAYCMYLNKKEAIKLLFIFVIPLMLFIVFLNPVFNHQGMTMLLYLPSNNPLTLESIINGIAVACIVGTVILWFKSYSEIMTSDKFVYIFGRIFPPLSLVVSMVLRFVPKFKSHWETVIDAQRVLGRDIKGGILWNRTKLFFKVLSIMITWSIENAVESAGSMKSRGYGTEKRTAFSIYKFDQRDRDMLIWLIFCGLYLGAGIMCKGLYFRYYPNIKGVLLNPFVISFFVVYLMLCITPLIVDIKEDRVWKHIQSEI